MRNLDLPNPFVRIANLRYVSMKAAAPAESFCPPPNVASNEAENVRSHEETVGESEEGWSEGSVEQR